MEHKIIKQHKNPFLHREELIIEISSSVPPSFEDVKKFVKKEESLVVVKKVKGNFGQHVFTADVVVYDNEKARKAIEVVPRKVKRKIAEEAKKKREEEIAAKKKAEEDAKKAGAVA